MNKRINKRWQSLLLVTIAAVFLLGASSVAFGQKSQKKEVAPSSKPKPKKTSSNSALTQAVVEEIITGRQKKIVCKPKADGHFRERSHRQDAKSQQSRRIRRHSGRSDRLSGASEIQRRLSLQ